MPWFEFTALDARGQARDGRLEAESEAQARSRLEARGWVPLTLAGAPGAALSLIHISEPTRRS